jgi:predicted DNA-binding protein
MALTFKLEPEQFSELKQSIDAFSTNLGKWQAQQIVAIEQGFTDLIETLGGNRSEETQERINQLASTVRTVKERIQSSVDSQMKETE